MGTRGFIGMVIDGVEKITYNHFDSYPSGLGANVLKWAKDVTDWEAVCEKARALRLVDEQSTPTEEEKAELAKFADSTVSTGSLDEWYVLLRELQGDVGGTLDVGFMIDSNGFALDSLFCEYGYLVDLDARTFEAYVGFQQTLPTEGRWAGRPTAEEDVENHRAHVTWCEENGRDPWMRETPGYKAVQRVGVWSLDALPTYKEFDKAFGEDDA